MAFYRFPLLFIFSIFYFQDLSENHPCKRVSWLKIIIIIIIIITIIIIIIIIIIEFHNR